MLLILSGFLAASAWAAPVSDMPVVNPREGEPATCPPTSRYEASRRGKTPGARKLNELPAADLYKTVYRRIGGCEVPIIVRYGVGGR